MRDKDPAFNFMATCIGSVPFLDIKSTCRDILDQLPDAPFWPQFVMRSPLEDMLLQFTEGFPFLKINESKREVAVSTREIESELVKFYDRFLNEDLNYFSISNEYAPGLYKLLDLISGRTKTNGRFIKGQIVGPVTLTSSIKDHNNMPVINNPDLVEATVKGLSVKALWQVKKLAESSKKTILFLDEPALSSVGSAFSSVQRDRAVMILKEVIDFLKEKSDALVGVHCCGNTDWSMIIEVNPDIINFDAFEYLDNFLLYRADILRFMDHGGALAWGIVPTATLGGNESVETLFAILAKGLKRLAQWGLDPEMLARKSILTPACGMGSMSSELAAKGLDLLCRLSRKCELMDS